MAGEWTIATLKEHFDALRSVDREARDSALASMDKRLDSLNELRGVLADQSKTLLPRPEYLAQHTGLSDRLSALEGAVSTIQATTKGREGIATPLMVALAGVGASALLAAALALTGHMR